MPDNVNKGDSKWDMLAKSLSTVGSGQCSDDQGDLVWNTSASNHACISKWTKEVVSDSDPSKHGQWNSWDTHENMRCQQGSIYPKESSPNAQKFFKDDCSPHSDSWRGRSSSLSPSRRCSSRSHRSTGPPPRFRRGPGWWAEKSHVRGSNLQCRDFIAGRCQKENECRYLHDYSDVKRHSDVNVHDVNLGSRPDRADSLPYVYPKDAASDSCNKKRGGTWGDYRGSKEGVQDKRDARMPYVHDGQRGRKFANTCKYFSEGRCRNGENCRFLHHTKVLDRSEASYQDLLPAHDSLKREKFWDDPKTGDADSDHAHDISQAPHNCIGSIINPLPECGPLLHGQHWGGVPSDGVVPIFPERVINSNNQPCIVTENREHNGVGECVKVGESVRSEDVTWQPNLKQNVKDQTLWNDVHEISVGTCLSANEASSDLVTGESLEPSRLPLQIPLSTSGQTYTHNLNLDLNPQPLTDQQLLPYCNMPSTDSLAQNSVTGQQAVQLSQLSASLAHIFANGHSLPTLYAYLNPPSSTSNQNIWHPQKLYDPVSDVDHPEPERESQLMSTLDPRCVVSGGMEQSAQDYTSVAVNNGGNDVHICGLEVPEDGEAKQFHGGGTTNMEGREGAGVHNDDQGNKHAVHTKVVMEGVAQEADRRNSDTHVARALRFALVEYVKDLLKPTWKGGHMSKETYKTIVKKAVDKVTGSIQGPNMPQTRERIDAYLSFSKPKISKLVQAYVEKYVRS